MFEAVTLTDQTWLICGGRDFTDTAMFDEVMSDLVRTLGCPSQIIHGGAHGADSMAKQFASRMSIDEIEVSADWAQHGKAAGPIRNQLMLEYKPALVVAFPGGKGTADMVERAHKAGVTVAEVKHVARSP